MFATIRNLKERKVPTMDSTKFVVSPITGEMIPLDQMAEHMRISLIDPKWKVQKEAMMAKLLEARRPLTRMSLRTY